MFLILTLLATLSTNIHNDVDNFHLVTRGIYQPGKSDSINIKLEHDASYIYQLVIKNVYAGVYDLEHNPKINRRQQVLRLKKNIIDILFILDEFDNSAPNIVKAANKLASDLEALEKAL